jgi:3-methyladenine DNA glycosylase/8-oxoguanine DNA glycosylase
LTDETAVVPHGPFSLALSTRHQSNATRVVRDGTLTTTLLVDGRIELASARQRPDGSVLLRAESERGIERMRFVLALDDDHSPFLERFADDPLLGEAIRRLRGLRPIRLGSVAHALLRALAGQLIDSRRAWSIEQRVIRATTPVRDGLHAPPTASDFARLAPAELRALGLGARRGAALVRVCRSFDPERLHDLATDDAARRIERERGLGPWSSGIVCLHGLGRPQRGLTGDLGLVKLLSALRGRRVEPEETAELLAPYEGWAGLASVYLLTGAGRGLVPLSRAA